MRRADRLFELIHLLRRARKAITAVQLAEALEVAPRTIYRDIAALMAMRVPIDGAAGVGYIMRPGYDLPPLMFDREEVEAVAVGLQLLNRTGDQDLQAAARRVAAKIAGVLPELRADELDDGRFVVSDFGTPAAADMGMLRSAVRDNRRLALVYRDERDRLTERTCLPLAVIYYIEVTVLAAWCELRDDFRHFRADRIVACHETGDSFADLAPHVATRLACPTGHALSGPGRRIARQRRAHRHHQPRHLLLMPAGIALDAQDSVFKAPVVQVRVYIVAARTPPRSEPQISHDRLPRAIPHSALSAGVRRRGDSTHRASAPPGHWRSKRLRSRVDDCGGDRRATAEPVGRRALPSVCPLRDCNGVQAPAGIIHGDLRSRRSRCGAARAYASSPKSP